jgi:hypothetical protein
VVARVGVRNQGSGQRRERARTQERERHAAHALGARRRESRESIRRLTRHVAPVLDREATILDLIDEDAR